jgi:hypothetical protein
MREEKTTISALAPQEGRARFSRLSHRYDRLLWGDRQAGHQSRRQLILTENHEPDLLERWFSDSGLDVRYNPAIGEHVAAFLKTHTVRSTVVADGIIGCPHEEGVDYPEAKYCAQCPYWEGRDRWTKERIH